jgi:two-component system chemotaxis response regulator CheB
VEDKDPIERATLYVAPPGYHLLVEPQLYFSVSVEEPVNFSRPSIDVLFSTGAQALGARLIAVLLTGANHDGADGLAEVRRLGGYAIVQDPASAEFPTMPEAALKAGHPHFQGTPAEIGRELTRITQASGRAT